MSDHAYFAPSAATRWLTCPASLFLGEKAKQRGSSYAHEGTVCHEIAADILQKKAKIEDYVGKIVNKVVMTPELIEAITLYTDEVISLTKAHSIIGGKIEAKVNVTEHCWGTVDALLWNETTLFVIDLKMGKGIEVDVEGNPQLKIYSIGGLRYLYDNFKLRLDNVVNIIVQPRIGIPVREAYYSTADLAVWGRDTLIPVVSKYKPGVNSGEAPVPSDKACRWCSVKATCTARAVGKIEETKEAFSPFTSVAAPIIDATSLQLRVNELAQMKKHFKGIQAWMSDIEEHLYTEAMNGVPIEGYKLVEGRSNRCWGVDEVGVIALLSEVNVEPFTKKLVSPAQAEKAMGKKVARDIKLDTFIMKRQGKPSLVESSDKRPELSLDIKADFAEFAEPDEVADDLMGSIIDTLDASPTAPQTATSGNPEKPQKLSAMERMRLMDDDEEVVETPFIPLDTGVRERLMERAKRISTTGVEEVVETLPAPAVTTVLEVKGSSGTPPKATSKRHEILKLGSNVDTPITLFEAAELTECSPNMVKMHLRYLNEKDGYGYKILSNDVFIIS